MFFNKNNTWFYFYHHQKHWKGTIASINGYKYIPTLVCSSSFIMMIKTIQNTTEYALSILEFYIDIINIFDT